MNELLRFTSTGTNGVSVLMPPKFDFVFYETKLEMYKAGKCVRTIEYSDITEIALIKTWKKTVFINCKPIGINIYNVTDEIYQQIKEITKK